MSTLPLPPDAPLLDGLAEIADSLDALNRKAVREYTPLVEDFLRAGCRDVAHFERTLDGLLDFCAHPPMVELYRRLCRHYWAIDPVATARYVGFYREMWDSEGVDDAEGLR